MLTVGSPQLANLRPGSRYPERSLGAVLSHPAGDGPLITLHRAARGTQQTVVQAVAQQLPHVIGMVGDPGQPLDHRGATRQGPVVVVEAAGARAQRLVDGGKPGIRQARRLPGRAGAAQRLGPAGAPAGVPAADDLTGHAEPAEDFARVAGGRQQLVGVGQALIQHTQPPAAAGGYGTGR